VLRGAIENLKKNNKESIKNCETGRDYKKLN